MSHLTAPAGFRVGKTFLWSQANTLTPGNGRKVVSSKLNEVKGIELVTKAILLKKGYYLVRFSFKADAFTGTHKGKLLYYPILTIPSYERVIPTYFSRRPFLRYVRKYSLNFGKLLRRLWLFKKEEFDGRFLSYQKKINYNKWLTLTMLRGSRLRQFEQLSKLNKLKAQSKLKKIRFFHKKVRRRFFQHKYSKGTKWWTRWLRSAHKGFPSRFLTRWLKLKAGLRVIFKTKNIFSYLSNKNKEFNYRAHQQHLWNPRYKGCRFDSPVYYDLVNSLYLFCRFPHLDQLIIRVIQFGLMRMHRLKLKPRRFFNFLDKIIKNFSDISDTFQAFRLVITGKLGGGTSRTSSFTIGYGVLPRQTLAAEISFAFGNVESKYGSYGVKMLTWRKSPEYRIKLVA